MSDTSTGNEGGTPVSPSKPKGSAKPANSKTKPQAKPKSKAALPKDGKPSVAIPMVWTAVGVDVPGSKFLEGVIFKWPVLLRDLNQAGRFEDCNTIILPVMRNYAEAVAKEHVQIQVTKSDAPDLVLYDATHATDSTTRLRLEGENNTIYSKYRKDNPFKFKFLNQEDWNKTVTTKGTKDGVNNR